MFIYDLFESVSYSTLVIYPGRFQPWHKGHKAVYDYLVKKFGIDQVFIATSNKVEPPRSPFNFSDKVQLMTLTGVTADHIVETRDPYKALEIVEKYNPGATRLIFAVSEKDMSLDPRFKFGTKKDGSPTYFQPMPSDTNDMVSLDQHGYIMTVPTFNFTVLGKPMQSATQVRDQFANADEATQKRIVADLFGRFDPHVLDLMQHKLGQLSDQQQSITEDEGDPEGVPHITKELLQHIVQQVGTQGAHAIVKSLEWGDGAAKELLQLIKKDLQKNIAGYKKQGVAEGKVINTYLWHGSRQKIPMLEPRQSVDTGGAAGSNQNAIYATSDPKVAIAMGLTTAGSDTGMFPNDPQMVLFSGKIRKGEYVYLHKLPFNGPDGKPQFVQGGNSREFHSIPGVEGIKPIEIKEIPVNKYLNLIRKATPADLKLRKKYMKKQGVAEGFDSAAFDRHMDKLRAQKELEKTDPMRALVNKMKSDDDYKQKSKSKPKQDSERQITDPFHPSQSVNIGEQGVAEEQHSCPHCNGPMFSEMIMNEKKDACYYKVKGRYKVWPSAYASGALVQCRKKGASNWGAKSESMTLEELEENLHNWFNKEKWVRMDTKGNIKGPCAREPGEGKPKCLPQSKAQNLGKEGRASAAARKRREDPNPDRSGKAINVATKKKS